MSNRKRGFVFYFDNILAVESLPPDQRGWLLSALCSYADRVCRTPPWASRRSWTCTPRCPSRPRWPAAFWRPGCCGTLRSGSPSRSCAHRRREQQGRAPLAARPASPAQDSAQSLERYRQDVELARRVLEESRREDEALSGERELKIWARRQARPTGCRKSPKTFPTA